MNYEQTNKGSKMKTVAITLADNFKRYEALTEKYVMWADRAKVAWESCPLYVGKIAGDSLPPYLGDREAAIKNLVLALESSVLAADRLKLSAEAIIKHISMEA